MNKPDILVIYHRADFDGLFCREIARKFLGDRASYVGWDYGDPVPVVADTAEVYMLDVSIAELMGHPRLVWIDHHKSAMEAYPAAICGYRIDGVAACRLAWQWFAGYSNTQRPFGDSGVYLPSKACFVAHLVDEPLAVRMVGEYDIWDKRDPRADLFQHGLRSQEIDFQRLLCDPRRYAYDYIAQLLEAGRFIEHARKEGMAYLMAEGAFELRWEGLLFLAINALRLSSTAFEGAVKPEHDACLSFSWSPKKRKWKVSMRGAPHKADFDLSVIAVKHGGGGHRQACGFECAVLPFELGTGGVA